MKGHQKIRMYKLTGWYKSMSKMKYKDKQLRLTQEGLETLRNAVSSYQGKNKWNPEYTKFLEDLEIEMLMLLCIEKYGEYKP